MFRSLNMNLYLRTFSIAICQKFNLYYLHLFRLFYSMVSKLCLLFQTILDLWPVLILEIFSSCDIQKDQFPFLVTFSAVFFWSVNCTNQVCISSHILNMGSVLFEGFQYLYLSKVRCVLFVPIQTFFWSANCTVLVCILYLLLQTILNLWPVLILQIFSCWDINRGQFQFLVTFLVVFFSGL